MGFLGVNTKRKSPFGQNVAKRSRKGSPLSNTCSRETTPFLNSSNPSETDTPGNDMSPSYAPIELSSSDILGLVLAYSGNLNLAQASPILAQKLRRTRHLELSMVRAQVYRHRLPVFPALKWPFVDARMLEELEVFQFINDWDSTNELHAQPFIPSSLETDADSERNIHLIAYMVRRGCRVEDTRKIYKVLARHDQWSAVEAMATRNHRADAEIVIMALRANQSAELAIQLLQLSHGVHGDWNQMWELQQAAREACIPEINAYIYAG